MELVLRRDVRIEAIEDQFVVLDRAGAVIHHVSGDRAKALDLVRHGIENNDVPTHLSHAIAELVDIGLITTSGWSRRRLLQAGGAGLVGAGIITIALPSPAAAASGTVTTNMRKTVNQGATPPLSVVCTTAASGNSVRGTAVWTRTEGGTVTDSFGNTFNAPAICVTCEMSTGTKANGREVYILQSNSGGCVGGISTIVGIWPGGPTGTGDRGPYTFCAPILSGATGFVVAFQESGGGGSDTFSSSPIADLP